MVSSWIQVGVVRNAGRAANGTDAIHSAARWCPSPARPPGPGPLAAPRSHFNLREARRLGARHAPTLQPADGSRPGVRRPEQRRISSSVTARHGVGYGGARAGLRVRLAAESGRGPGDGPHERGPAAPERSTRPAAPAAGSEEGALCVADERGPDSEGGDGAAGRPRRRGRAAARAGGSGPQGRGHDWQFGPGHGPGCALAGGRRAPWSCWRARVRTGSDIRMVA